MSDITIKTYTTPCKSRSGNYSDGTTVVQSSGSVSYIGSGGSSVDIVKELGTDTLSDANVFSSLRTIKEITDRGHTHANKSALDNLTQTVIDNSHTHSNKSILDGITSALVSDWNNAVHKSGDESITGTKTFDNLKCTTSEFTGLMKAASITLTGILTAATINATTINQNGNAVLDASNYTNYTYSQSTIGSLIDTAKTAAINTAASSAASLYLPLSGGTMKGLLTINCQPWASQIKLLADNPAIDFSNPSGANLGYLNFEGAHGWYLGSATSNFIYCNSNGNIGIGTTSPLYRFHVNGTGYFSDAVTLNSTLSVAGPATLNGGISTTNITADSLSVKSFTADISQTLAGSDYLTKSVSKLSENFVIPAVGSSVRVIVDDLEGFPSTACFASGDYIRFRAFNRTSGLTIADAWGTVVLDTTYGTNGYSNGTQAYTFTCTSTACAGLTVYKGSEVLDYGTSGSGLIVRTTLDSAGSPYSQISTWQTDPSNSANYSVHVRLGNLAGLANCSGYGLYTDNAFLTKQLLVGDLTKTNNYLSYDATNGLVIKGNLYAASGAQVATSTDVTNLNAAIQANASAISLCVTSTTYNQGIASCNTYADNAVGNLQVGGRNLLPNSAYIAFNYNDVGTGTSVLMEDEAEKYYRATPSTGNKVSLYGAGYKYPKGLFIGSIYVRQNSGSDVALSFHNNVSGITVTHNNLKTGVWTQINFIAFNFIGDASTYSFILIIEDAANVSLDYKKVKIEVGNKATDWTPAPEDVDASIATKVATSTYDAKMTLIDSQISSKVSQTDFNALGQRVSSTESSITQLPNMIDARITTQVSTNGSIYNAVASSLTMTAEGISLFGKTIQLAGATTFVSSLNSTAHGYATTAKTEAISASLSNTTTAINNLSLSGRNLISQNFSTTQSTEEMGEEVWAIVTHNYGDGYKYAKSTRIQFSLSQNMSYVIHINLLSSMIEGKTYTFSFWYKCLGTTSFSLETGFISETSASTAWKFYSGNITMNSGESRSYIEAFQGKDEQADILISDVTLYEGTKYMGFNLSPEDVNDAMAKNLGYTDYSALNTAATAGTTIIKGGKINTVLIEAHSIAVEKLIAGSITSDYLDASSIKADIINVSYINTLGITSLGSVTAGSFNLGNGQFIVDNGGNLIANNAVISGNITATSGSIGGFSVSSNQLIATSGANTMLLSASLIRFQSTYDAVYLGSNTISSIAANSLVPMRVEVSRSGSSSDMYMNIGTYYYVDGATSLDSSPEYGNHAIYIGKGNICGFRRTGRRVTSNITASVMDSVFMVFNAVTITLPSSTAEDMQEYFIIDAGGVNITLNAGSGYNVTFKNTSNGGQTWDFSGFKTAIVVFDKTNSIWRGCLTAGQ